MHKLQMKKLGNSDMSITPVGFGAWTIGGSCWQFKESIAAIPRLSPGRPNFKENLAMEMIKIPHTDLEVSRLALGCMGLGGGWDADVQLTKDHKRQAREFLDAAEEIGAIGC
jgi:aryl-alcohol dehydrogenase-like predicted oxidoreductase